MMRMHRGRKTTADEKEAGGEAPRLRLTFSHVMKKQNVLAHTQVNLSVKLPEAQRYLNLVGWSSQRVVGLLETWAMHDQ